MADSNLCETLWRQIAMFRPLASEAASSSLITIRRTIVKKPDSLSRQWLAQHQPKRREPFVEQINFQASLMGNYQGELEWILAPLMPEILTELLLPLVRSNHHCLLASSYRLPVQETIVFRP